MIVYLDTSAALKLVVEEPESAALAAHLEGVLEEGDRLVASLLLHTELHCAANRRPDQIGHGAVADVLSTVALVDLERSDLTTAPSLAGRLGSADALHLATALRVNAAVLVAYDGELCAAARAAGIEVRSPTGADSGTAS